MIASYGVTVIGPVLKTRVCVAASAGVPKESPTTLRAASTASRRTCSTPRLYSARLTVVSWLSIALLAAAVVILVAAEWPRLTGRFGSGARKRRDRARRKAALQIVRTEQDEFAASVERDLDQLPTIEERDRY